MKIFRFEHIYEGIGPMCGGGIELTGTCWFHLFKEHSAVEEFEIFRTKFPAGVREFHKFGMSTLEGLLGLCFSHTAKHLRARNFGIFVYEIDDDFVVCPDGQVVFDNRKAKKSCMINENGVIINTY